MLAGLGHVLWKKGSLYQAFSTFDDALRRHPNKDSHQHQSKLLRQMSGTKVATGRGVAGRAVNLGSPLQRLQTSLDHAKEAVRLDVTDPESWYILGEYTHPSSLSPSLPSLFVSSSLALFLPSLHPSFDPSFLLSSIFNIAVREVNIYIWLSLYRQRLPHSLLQRPPNRLFLPRGRHNGSLSRAIGLRPRREVGRPADESGRPVLRSLRHPSLSRALRPGQHGSAASLGVRPDLTGGAGVGGDG